MKRRAKRAIPIFIVGLGVGVAGGCSALLNIEADRYLAILDSGPATTIDVAVADARAPREAGPWDCLDDPNEVPNPEASVDLTLLVLDPTKGVTTAGAIDGGSDLETTKYVPLAGVTATPCAGLSFNCDPQADSRTTDDAGLVHFTMNEAWGGRFELSRSDLLSSIYYPGNLPLGEAKVSVPHSMLTTDGANAITAVLGVPVPFDKDSGVGEIFFTIFDCHDHHAEGITATINRVTAQTVIFYVRNGFPSTSAGSTDSVGTGGIVNVPMGEITVTSTILATQRALGSTAVIVRPGEATTVNFRMRAH